MSVQSFIFGPGQKYKTQEELDRARATVRDMYGNIGSPKNIGEGLSALGDGILANVMNRRIAQGQGEFDKNRASADAEFLNGAGSGFAPAFPASVAAGGSTTPTESGDYFSKIRSAESGGNDSAKNPLSSATGRYQFTTGTWNQLAQQNPQLGLTADGRNDPEQQERAIRAFTSQNAGVLGNAGIEATNPNLYAAHFLGAGGATKVLSQADNAPVASIVGPGVVKANPFLANMTVGDFKNWTAKKVGGNGGGVQVASLDPSAGMGQAYAPAQPQPQNGAAQAINQVAPQQNNYPEAGKVAPVDWTDQQGLSQAAGLSFSKGIGQDDQQQMASLPSQPVMSPLAPVQPTGQPQAQDPARSLEIRAQAGAGDKMVAGADQTIQPPAPSNNALQQNGDRLQYYARNMANPFLSPQYRKLAEIGYQQEMERQQQASDPRYQMGLEKDRLELNALKNPPVKYDFISGRDGAIFRSDNRGNIESVYGGKPDTFRTLTADEKKQAGLPLEGAYQIGADNKITQIGGGGTTVNIDQKSEGAFDKKLAENQATMFDNMLTEGQNAKSDLAVIGELGQALQGQGGILTGLSGRLARYGIGGENVSDLQAADALINKLIPTQRQAGSGSMSDRDVEMFRASLPSLWNTPEGNRRIIGVMQGLAQYKDQQGAIAARVMNNEITRQQGIQELRALPNPLAGFGKPANVKTDAEYDALPTGAQFVDPDGKLRRKP